MPSDAFSALSAADRAAALVDPGSLAILPRGEGRSCLLTARGRIGGRDTLLALTDGQQRGGTVGLAESRHFGRLLTAAPRRPAAVVVCWDTGGVRVQEGPAALAAASAIGVALARLALGGTAVVSVISGPRGCFGAPAVIAAAGHALLMTDSARWGLTGPQLLERGAEVAEAAGAAMAASARRAAGHATAVVRDTPAAVRAELTHRLAVTRPRVAAPALLDHCLATTDTLLAQLQRSSGTAPERTGAEHASGRRRDFFAYSFRGRWRTIGPSFRLGQVHAAWGELAGAPALGVIVGPERSPRGIGIADAHAILQALRYVVANAPGAPIVTFLFCRGHATDLHEERAGLPRALAECLRGMMTARLRGHPLLCVLGGGAYGAAYLTLAAPSHRILAMRGTTVAPMAPRVLAAFQRLRGLREAAETPADLAAMIPEIHVVESVVRLPRALGDQLAAARQAAAGERHRARFTLPDA
jgi:Malonate decarboxylase gamma subunit/Carboxyl transferase domain